MALGNRNGALYHNRDEAERATLISVNLHCTFQVDAPGKARAKTARVVCSITLDAENREKEC